MPQLIEMSPTQIPQANKIEVIEGPAPIFAPIEATAGNQTEGNNFIFALCAERAGTGQPLVPFVTRLRSYNAPALSERCHQAWQRQEDMVFVYQDEELGMSGQKVLILAARATKIEDIDALILWVGFPQNLLPHHS